MANTLDIQCERASQVLLRHGYAAFLAFIARNKQAHEDKLARQRVARERALRIRLARIGGKV